jgi:hypothetical protein
VRSTTTGVRFDPLLPFEAWKELGGRLGLYANATSWWLGDWLAFGQMKYGRRYKEAIAATGLDYQTLRNYAVVARRFELSRRRDDLTFQHHAELCALHDEEQDRWLDRASAGHWSRNELRRRLRAADGQRAAADEILRLAVAHGGPSAGARPRSARSAASRRGRSASSMTRPVRSSTPERAAVLAGATCLRHRRPGPLRAPASADPGRGR